MLQEGKKTKLKKNLFIERGIRVIYVRKLKTKLKIKRTKKNHQKEKNRRTDKNKAKREWTLQSAFCMPTKHLLYVPKRTDKMKYLQGNSPRSSAEHCTENVAVFIVKFYFNYNFGSTVVKVGKTLKISLTNVPHNDKWPPCKIIFSAIFFFSFILHVPMPGST